MNKTLLPKNSTALERTLEKIALEALNFAWELNGYKYKSQPPKNIIPALIYEFSAEKIRELLGDENILQNAIILNRYKGTPYVLNYFLEQANLSATIRESGNSAELRTEVGNYQVFNHFAEFDLYLQEIPTVTEIEKIKAITDLTKPERSRLWRLVKGLDIDVFKLSASNLDCELLDDDSGVKSQEIKLSFASNETIFFQFEQPLIDVQREIYSNIFINRHESSEILYLDDLPPILEIDTAMAKEEAEATFFNYESVYWTAFSWKDVEHYQASAFLISKIELEKILG